MSYVDFVGIVHKSTPRDYVQRVVEHDKAHCAEVAGRFGYDYWDGDRKYGFGGYRYDGRWRAVAEAMVEHYALKPDARILDIDDSDLLVWGNLAYVYSWMDGEDDQALRPAPRRGHRHGRGLMDALDGIDFRNAGKLHDEAFLVLAVEDFKSVRLCERLQLFVVGFEFDDGHFAPKAFVHMQLPGGDDFRSFLDLLDDLLRFVIGEVLQTRVGSRSL